MDIMMYTYTFTQHLVIFFTYYLAWDVNIRIETQNTNIFI